jgi:hypothetical protein
MREGTASRVMVANRPYGEFYDFYSVIQEYFGCTLVYTQRTVQHTLTKPMVSPWVRSSVAGSLRQRAGINSLAASVGVILSSVVMGQTPFYIFWFFPVSHISASAPYPFIYKPGDGHLASKMP